MYLHYRVVTKQLDEVHVKGHVKGFIHDGQIHHKVVFTAVEHRDPILTLVGNADQDLGTNGIFQIQIRFHFQQNIAFKVLQESERNAFSPKEIRQDTVQLIGTARVGSVFQQRFQLHFEGNAYGFQIVQISVIRGIV